ncbi:MAG TPA: DNA repair protein RecN [Rikenellaceae bacterium]|nr:DNA repair protein RecN [Rikenellaceae bacterium]
MLESLQIRNYVLIDSLDIKFPEGLIIISGQTGAGKSILLGALSLLLGSKADASVIGGDADSCVVEAVFRIPETDHVLKDILAENDVDAVDEELIIRRVVNRSGRSRSFINDSPVNLQILQSISSRLVDIHSQHQTLLLSDRSFQLSMLDHFAGDESLLEECGESFRRFKTIDKEYSEITSKLARMSEEKEYVRARWQRLEDARLQDGELDALEAEQKQLSNAEEIKENLGGVEELFCPSDPNSEALPLSSVLKEAQKMLDKAARFVPEAAGLSDRIDSARTELDDILEEVSAINSRIELSQERLGAVDERLSLLYDLMKGYSASTVAELIAKRDTLSESLFDSAALEARKSELEAMMASEKKTLETVSKRLHEARVKASEPFSKAITASVRSLEMDHAVFKVELSDAQVSAVGSDAVRFLFSASGAAPADVAKCASGGEMSRLMLCLKAMMAKFVNMPTLIFDEIDTGVSGSVADKMGRMICSMGKDMQVFAITHLPQVAAKGNAHYVVEKEYDVLGKATTSVRPLEGHERVMEIARMLSGSSITTAAVENAKALLSI